MPHTMRCTPCVLNDTACKHTRSTQERLHLLLADHGLYAHQTPTFDSYAASQEFPMHITEHSNSSSYKLVGEVAGVLKMTGKHAELCYIAHEHAFQAAYLAAP